MAHPWISPIAIVRVIRAGNVVRRVKEMRWVYLTYLTGLGKSKGTEFPDLAPNSNFEFVDNFGHSKSGQASGDTVTAALILFI